eukprot:scaffold177456_cov15-Tisochrysis_lutea.AAC.1
MCEHERDSSRVAALQLFVRSKGVTKRTGVGKRGSNGVANMCEHEPDSSRIVALHYKLQLQLLDNPKLRLQRLYLLACACKAQANCSRTDLLSVIAGLCKGKASHMLRRDFDAPNVYIRRMRALNVYNRCMQAPNMYSKPRSMRFAAGCATN